MKAKVLKSVGSSYTVLLDNEEVVNCRIRGKFRLKGLKVTNPVAVGDFVEVELGKEGEAPVIVKIYDRKNYIIRRSVNLSKQYHILASNVDQAILIVTLRSPETSFEFIDRFLISAEAYQIPVVIIVNKLDLYGEGDVEKLAELLTIYEELEYEVKVVSVLKKKRLEEVKEVLKDKVSVVVGHSGVGKSSLLNELLPDYEIKTSEISEMHQQGMHTTTFAEMYDLPGGGEIIDTPGIKGIGVVDIEKQEVSNYFREFLKASSACHFNDCLHINEPKCEVKKLVEEGEISDWRYRSYMSIIEDGDEIMYR